MALPIGVATGPSPNRGLLRCSSSAFTSSVNIVVGAAASRSPKPGSSGKKVVLSTGSPLRLRLENVTGPSSDWFDAADVV